MNRQGMVQAAGQSSKGLGRAGGRERAARMPAAGRCQTMAANNQWLLIGSKPKHTWISRSFCRDSSSGSSSLQMEHRWQMERVVRNGGHEAGHSEEANRAGQP